MDKAAEIITRLLPQQIKALKKIQQQPGLLLQHGLGSGKTLSSIAMVDLLGKPTTVVAPAALIPNYKKEIRKHILGDKEDIDYISVEKLRRNPELLQDKTNVLVVDEAHRLRNTSSPAYKAIQDMPAEKKILLSATPGINKPEDIRNLVRLIDPSPKSIANYIDFYTSPRDKNFPTRIDKKISVKMAPKQEELFKDYLYSNTIFGTKKVTPYMLKRIMSGMPVDFQEKELGNFFMGNTRQISNDINKYNDEFIASPKIKRVIRDIKNGPGKTIVYSNYIGSGITPLKDELTSQGYSVGTFTGQDTKSEKEKAIMDYNNDKLDVLLLSASGGEGLDLKGTRQIQILEPHWNESRIEQVIGRGIRYKSHEHLPRREQNVQVKYYNATPKVGIGTDDYLRRISLDKQKDINTYITRLKNVQHRMA